MKKSLFLSYVYASLAMLMWGYSFIWIKQTFDYLNPVGIIFIRLVISSCLLLSYVFIFKKVEKIEKKDYKWFLLLAFLEPFVYFLCESNGVKLLPSTIAAIIISTIPIFTPIAGLFLFKEKITLLNYLGIVLSFVGITLMVVDDNFNLKAPIVGLILMFMAVIAGILYTIVTKKIANKYSPIFITTMQNFIGTIYFIPVFFIFDFQHTINATYSFDLILNITYLSVFGSTLAFLFYTISIRDLGISKSALLTNLIPVFTAITAYFVLKEKFTCQKITGMIIVLFGIMIAEAKIIKSIRQ
ncbi:MAG: hypothetical protein A2X12_01505 [Bacteroidetes bacterium GWE2_29_8]|nr:MAG: hypothetical protein A2X12_01505 [Bacteroidetes bacterium GWE2_29_8]